MIILEAFNMSSVILLICLFIGLIISIPLFVYFAVKRNTAYDAYSTSEKIGYVLLVGSGWAVGIIALVVLFFTCLHSIES
jgi:ABC-type dipeptide/oligopeptide/nickel transport system permease component